MVDEVKSRGELGPDSMRGGTKLASGRAVVPLVSEQAVAALGKADAFPEPLRREKTEMKLLKLIEADLQTITQEDIKTSRPEEVKLGEKILNSEVDPQIVYLHALKEKYNLQAHEDMIAMRTRNEENRLKAAKSLETAKMFTHLFWAELRINIPGTSDVLAIGVRMDKGTFVIVDLSCYRRAE